MGQIWYTFNFAGDNGYMVLEMNPEWEVARFKDHLSIGATYGTWPNLSAVEYGLFVSGSSVFYSGGTNNSDPVSIYSYGTYKWCN